MQTETEPTNSIQTASIDRIVSDSMKQNQAPKHRTKVVEIPIRAGGRPRKGNAPNRATLKMMGERFEEVKAGPAHQNPATEVPPNSGPTVSGESVVDSSALAADLPDEMVAYFLKAPSTLARDLTGFEKFTLSDETAMQAVPLAKQCIAQYFPELEKSRHYPLYMLLLTVGGPLALQTVEYFKFKNARQVKSTPVKAESVAPPIPVEMPNEILPGMPNPFRTVFQ